MTTAVILWFFLGFLAAHQFYLGRTREGIRLVLLYFFAPLIAVIVVVVGMQLMGIRLLPPMTSPDDIAAITKDVKVLALSAFVFLVLAGVWIWDLKRLIRQVRVHNAQPMGRPPEIH